MAHPSGGGGRPMGGAGGEISGNGGAGGGAGSQNTGPNDAGESKYLDEEVCFQNELATDIITQMATELGIDEEKVIINPGGTPCTQRYTGCYPAGTNKFDILKEMVALCGYGVVDTGEGVIIQPPTPTNVHHYLDDYHHIFVIERDYSDADLYHHVEVFQPPLVVNGVEVKPARSKIALVNTPFNPDPDSVFLIKEENYNLTDDQLQNIANLEAGKISGLGAMVQVTTLWREGRNFALYDQLHLRRYQIGWFTNWMIRSLEHTFSDDGNLTIVQASLIGDDAPPALPPGVNESQPLKPQLANYP